MYIINVHVAGPGGEGLLPPGEDDITDQYYADQYDQYYRYGRLHRYCPLIIFFLFSIGYVCRPCMSVYCLCQLSISVYCQCPFSMSLYCLCRLSMSAVHVCLLSLDGMTSTMNCLDMDMTSTMHCLYMDGMTITMNCLDMGG